MRIHCRRLVLPDAVLDDVAVDLDSEGGRVSACRPGDVVDHVFELAAPAFANTHSHAFHRLLRGRTNGDGGDFWRWRERMYAAASRLDPRMLRTVATGVYAEMVAAGYSAVGEFHYLHHRRDGTPYPDHDMERALADAAAAAGIRLTLLDTCYLRAGFGRDADGVQRRYSDGDVERWLARRSGLASALSSSHPDVVVGAAVHSVRAVGRADLAVIARELAGAPLHVHVSEQPAENAECLRATGLTPTALLAESGLLSPRTTVVHATHVGDDDIRMLGDARVTVSMCPTTEADLGDGRGSAAELHEAGARLAIGSDQNVVIDPFDELRRLEGGARLATHRRGVFPLAALWRAGTTDGHAALHPARDDRFDLIELDSSSPRLAGADPAEVLLVAAASDVLSTVIRGRRHLAAESLDLARAAYRDLEEASVGQ